MTVTETSEITGPVRRGASRDTTSSPGGGERQHGARPLPWQFLLAMTLAGSCLPAIQSFRTPEPWMARVLLSERQVDAPYPSPGFDLAVGALSTPAALGRAVDLLGLDKDAEFNGGKATALTVALELLNGAGASGTDARRNAVDHLAELIRVERLSRPGNAVLLVKASGQEKAERIGEALAAVFTAPTDITGPVPVHAAPASQLALQKAEADLAAFQTSAGNDELAAALVDRSRIAGLDDHIGRLRQSSTNGTDPLAKATIADLLAGRVAGGISDAGLSAQLDAWQQAKLTFDTLSGSLGPKHPQLLAAQSALDEARSQLTQGLARYKAAAERAAADRQKQLAILEKSRADLEASLAGSGLDLERYDSLTRAVEQARQPQADLQPATPAEREPILEASAVEPLAAPSTLALPLRMLLGGISGLGAALAFSLALRSHRQPVVREQVEGEGLPVVETVQPNRERTRVEPPALQGPQTGLPPARDGAMLTTPKPAPVAVNRQHAAANTVEADWLPGDALNISDDDLVPLAPVHERHPEQAETRLSTVVKLSRVAPHVFALPEEDAEVQRLRQELADLRSRVLRRTRSGA